MALFDRSALQDGVSTREMLSWALFDAANSGYSTVVLTAVFNAYFVSTVCQGQSWATFLWSATIALSNAIGMLLMPSISRIADVTARKKLWLFWATVVCVTATAALAFAGPGTYVLAVSMIVLSNLGYSIGETLNSAFLPEIARPESFGRVSGWGWSLGYVGGLVTLGLCLLVVLGGQSAGYSEAQLVPATNLVTAAVFILVSLPIFLWLKERAVAQPCVGTWKDVLAQGRGQMMRSIRSLWIYRDFGWLVVCGFFYQCGIATVITLAAIYASAVMGFTMTDTLVMVLLVNITAALGAFGFGYVQDRLGHKLSLALTLIVWIAMVATAALATEAWIFWISANLAGLAMGSSQSAGRAMVAVFAPKVATAQFYGLWNMALWLSAIVGPITYGTVTWVTGNDQRLAILVTGLFFVIGLLALVPVNVSRGAAMAQAPLTSKLLA